jgi:hypothetical protein
LIAHDRAGGTLPGANRELLERALAAEERADAAEARLADLEARLRSAINADPTTASRALSWIGRAEEAERLLRQLMLFIEQRSIDTREFPGGWVERTRSQLRAVDILNRDLHHLVERPEDDDYWATTVQPTGEKGIVIDP